MRRWCVGVSGRPMHFMRAALFPYGCEHISINARAEGADGERGGDEQPELIYRLSANEEGGTEAARGIDRNACHLNSDNMNCCECYSDRESGELHLRGLMRDGKYHEHKEGRHGHFEPDGSI